MEPSIPWSLLRKPLDIFTQWLFLDAHEVSDSQYWSRRGLGSSWRRLGNSVEYDTHLDSIYSNQPSPMPYISVRAVGSEEILEVKIKVTAIGGPVDYQEILCFFNLGDKPIVKAMPSIPLKSSWVSSRGIETPYTDIVVELLIEDTVEKDIFVPSYDEVFDTKFVKRWGIYWNMEEIEWQKQQLKEYIYYGFIFKNEFLIKEPGWLHPKKIVALILCNRYSISTAFWLKNIRKASSLRAKIKSNEA